MLGELISARRPSVSSALKSLTEDGSVVRRPDGTFELHGGPPTSARPLDIQRPCEGRSGT